ncbi:hypothetical protein AALB16_02735 [Lachnospiraceae bacterium 62-35]
MVQKTAVPTGRILHAMAETVISVSAWENARNVSEAAAAAKEPGIKNAHVAAVLETCRYCCGDGILCGGSYRFPVFL